jgi:hypothetical protein
MTSTSPEKFLKTISSPKQIHDHPVNNSPAKALYSFPHAERFPKRDFASPGASAPFYNIHESTFRNKRTCSLGKGNKYDFTKNAKDVPGPGNYFRENLPTANDKKKGFSFGLSRESAPQHGITPMLKAAASNPGPGTYKPELPRSHKCVTFRIRLDKQHKENQAIGPGQYDVASSFEPSKRIFNSKFMSTKSIKFAPLQNLVNDKDNHQRSASTGSDGMRQGDSNTTNQIYDTKYQINKLGQFFNSKYKNSRCRSFGKADRDNHKKFSNDPGPGNYLLLSEFGLYESSTAVKQN